MIDKDLAEIVDLK